MANFLLVYTGGSMPATPEEFGSGPDWVSWVGCIHPGFDRSCADCGHTWDARLDDEDREVDE